MLYSDCKKSLSKLLNLLLSLGIVLGIGTEGSTRAFGARDFLNDFSVSNWLMDIVAIIVFAIVVAPLILTRGVSALRYFQGEAKKENQTENNQINATLLGSPHEPTCCEKWVLGGCKWGGGGLSIIYAGFQGYLGTDVIIKALDVNNPTVSVAINTSMTIPAMISYGPYNVPKAVGNVASVYRGGLSGFLNDLKTKCYALGIGVPGTVLQTALYIYFGQHGAARIPGLNQLPKVKGAAIILPASIGSAALFGVGKITQLYKYLAGLDEFAGSDHFVNRHWSCQNKLIAYGYQAVKYLYPMALMPAYWEGCKSLGLSEDGWYIPLKLLLSLAAIALEWTFYVKPGEQTLHKWLNTDDAATAYEADFGYGAFQIHSLGFFQQMPGKTDEQPCCSNSYHPFSNNVV